MGAKGPEFAVLGAHDMPSAEVSRFTRNGGSVAEMTHGSKVNPGHIRTNRGMIGSLADVEYRSVAYMSRRSACTTPHDLFACEGQP